MKKIYITDSQFKCLKKIAISQHVKVSSLVQIAVNLAFHPIIYNHLDIPIIDKPYELRINDG